MSLIISELELVGLMKSFLKKARGTATTEEERAWREFHAIHDGIIKSVIRRIHKTSDVVEDLTQAVWVDVIQGLKRLRLDPTLGSVTGWVVKIASDRAKEYARFCSKHRTESLSLEAADELPARERRPDVEFEWLHSEEELRRLIGNFAASLPDERERRVLALYWLDERSLSWIAADMMISEDSVWGILRRVSLKLADHLRRRGYGAS